MELNQKTLKTFTEIAENWQPPLVPEGQLPTEHFRRTDRSNLRQTFWFFLLLGVGLLRFLDFLPRLFFSADLRSRKNQTQFFALFSTRSGIRNLLRTPRFPESRRQKKSKIVRLFLSPHARTHTQSEGLLLAACCDPTFFFSPHFFLLVYAHYSFAHDNFIFVLVFSYSFQSPQFHFSFILLQ